MTIFGKGWIPDFPDYRDYTNNTSEVKELVGVLPTQAQIEHHKIRKVDLRKWFSPIENQRQINSCTANAGAALLEYYQRRSGITFEDVSRLFLYKTTRNLLGQGSVDMGAYLRTTMQAMALFGVCPETYFPYTEENVFDEPSAFCYAYASNYQSLKYMRLDPTGIDRTALLASIKENLSIGIPSMFGFSTFGTINNANVSGHIPYPGRNDKFSGGHAVVCCGFDDDMIVGRIRGALIIRNSWGESWGDRGYGYLPYGYVLSGLAVDWWTLLDQEWLDSGKFSLER